MVKNWTSRNPRKHTNTKMYKLCQRLNGVQRFYRKVEVRTGSSTQMEEG